MMIKSFLLEYLPLIGLVLVLAVLLVVWAFRLSSKAGGEGLPLEHRWQKGVDVLDGGADGDGIGDSLMGAALPDEGVVILNSDEFGFAGEAVAAGENLDKGDQLGLLADVQQEIKSVCALLVKKDGGKEDFLTLFELIRAKYPKMAGHAAVSELGQFIHERVPFHLSDEELDNLWV